MRVVIRVSLQRHSPRGLIVLDLLETLPTLLRVNLPHGRVRLRARLRERLLLRGHLAHHPRGRARPELPRRHRRPGRHERAGGDHRARLHGRAVHHRRAHADERVVLDRARVDDRVVTHGDAIADDGRERDAADVCLGDVHDGVVLDVREGSDRHWIDVAAEDRAVPHAGVFADRDVADDGRGRRDEPRGRELRDFLVDLLDRAMLADRLSKDVGTLKTATDAIERLARLAERRAESVHDARHGQGCCFLAKPASAAVGESRQSSDAMPLGRAGGAFFCH
eukprot:31307-Pelagococcus_subviridis.AAC.11